VAEQTAVGFSDATVSHGETIDGDDGRIEIRAVGVNDMAWLNHRETRFYIAYLTAPVSLVGPAIRDHRSIENSLHWVTDMTFRDDECPDGARTR
jgi:hypothetical protein